MMKDPGTGSILLRINQWLLMLVLITLVLYYGSDFLIPLFFSVLLAMLMAPVCRFFDRRGFHRIFSALFSITILIIAIAGLMAIIIAQIGEFSQDMETIRTKFSELSVQLQQWISAKMGIGTDQQQEIIGKQSENLKDSSSFSPLSLISSMATFVGSTAIALVFCFLFLLHKEKYEAFFLKLFKHQDQKEMSGLISEIARVAQQYLTGRALSIVFLFVLYSIALLIIGIKNALLLSAIASILTIIPYIGPILGGLFPLMTALVTEDSSEPAIWVAIAILGIQVIENYFVEPVVIGGEVKLSAFSTIAAIVIGGLIWGVAGMVIFIPLLSIIKIIFDHLESFKPYGYLLGDQGSSATSIIKKWFSGKKSAR